MICHDRGGKKPKISKADPGPGKTYNTKSSYGDKDNMERNPVDTGSTPKDGEIVEWG